MESNEIPMASNFYVMNYMEMELNNSLINQ